MARAGSSPTVRLSGCVINKAVCFQPVPDTISARGHEISLLCIVHRAPVYRSRICEKGRKGERDKETQRERERERNRMREGNQREEERRSRARGRLKGMEKKESKRETEVIRSE